MGLAYEIVFAFALSFTELSRPHPPGTLPPGPSFVCVLIILFPMFIPGSPRKTILAALAAATTGPLAAVVYSLLRDQLFPNAQAFLWAYLFNYITVALAVFPAAVLRRLGREVSKARKMGSYELRELLGRGGMGEVWRANHLMLSRPAAIKLIRPEALGAGHGGEAETLMHRFEREAEATSKLHSHHTIQLYDFGITEEGAFFYVMELLDGFNLDTLVRRFGPQSAERTVHLLTQACDSLWDAHRSSLIHRDVKPANIYACRYGHWVDFVKILDFGLVKQDGSLAVQEATLTRADSMTGTPAYMAPEMALGERRIDARADIYSLGCVGYWLLTGHRVFERDTPMKTVLAHIQERPVPPSQLTELEIPESLERVVLSCLEKDPDHRPKSAKELSDALRACRLGSEWKEESAVAWWGIHHQPLQEADPTSPTPGNGPVPRVVPRQ
jgi:serine/threonine-protein kinase